MSRLSEQADLELSTGFTVVNAAGKQVSLVTALVHAEGRAANLNSGSDADGPFRVVPVRVVMDGVLRLHPEVPHYWDRHQPSHALRLIDSSRGMVLAKVFRVQRDPRRREDCTYSALGAQGLDLGEYISEVAAMKAVTCHFSDLVIDQSRLVDDEAPDARW